MSEDRIFSAGACSMASGCVALLTMPFCMAWGVPPEVWGMSTVGAIFVGGLIGYLYSRGDK